MNRHDIVEAFRIQGRVLLALMLREARTRYGRRQAGYLWALVEPIMHIVVFVGLFRYSGRAVPIGDSLMLFLATGMATFLGFRNVLNRTQGGYGSNEALLSFPIVKVMDCFLGRTLLEVCTWVAVSFILLGSLIAVGEAPLPRSPLMMLNAVLALACIGFGAGVCIGIVSEFIPSVAAFLKMPMRILYFSSAVFFLPDQLPPAARNIVDWNPVMHGVTLFRMGYYQMYDSYMLDPLYLWQWAIGCVLMAMLVERVARKPLRSLST